MTWAIDKKLTQERKERVFRHRCPTYGPLILSDSQCGIYKPTLFDGEEYGEELEPGCPWCGDLPPEQ